MNEVNQAINTLNKYGQATISEAARITKRKELKELVHERADELGYGGKEKTDPGTSNSTL